MLEAAVEAQDPRELQFVLMGTEGEEFDAVLQAQDGRVGNYRESGIVGEWQIFTGCIDVGNCGGSQAP